MMMTAEQIRGMDLDNWSGTITMFSPVRIGRRVGFELEKDAARYVLTFRYGTVSVLRRGTPVEIGVMNQGVLELYQFGIRREMLRHLLHPHTMQLERQAQFAHEAGKSQSLLEPYRSTTAAWDCEDALWADEPDDSLRCRFWNLQMCFLYFVSVERLRYWVSARRRARFCSGE